MPGAKQGHDDDRGQDAECSELSGTEYWTGTGMAVPARFQSGLALEEVG
ncbi:MAG TPA: hypothetical protein VGI74_18415 [Streptosporangiaceae bacterium]